MAVTNVECQHPNIEIEKPCCDGKDCGCHGAYILNCPDCHNEDLYQYQIDEFLENYE